MQLDDIVSLKQKITKLFEASIKTIAPDEPNIVPLILPWSKNGAGDYQLWYTSFLILMDGLYLCILFFHVYCSIRLTFSLVLK